MWACEWRWHNQTMSFSKDKSSSVTSGQTPNGKATPSIHQRQAGRFLKCLRAEVLLQVSDGKILSMLVIPQWPHRWRMPSGLCATEFLENDTQPWLFKTLEITYQNSTNHTEVFARIPVPLLLCTDVIPCNTTPNTNVQKPNQNTHTLPFVRSNKNTWLWRTVRSDFFVCIFKLYRDLNLKLPSESDQLLVGIFPGKAAEPRFIREHRFSA